MQQQLCVTILVLVLRWMTVYCQCENETDISLYNCPSGYYEYNKICYKAVFSRFSFGGAQKHCAADGGSLVSILDSEVSKFLFEILLTRYKVPREQQPLPFWIGLSDRQEEGVYVWSRCGDGALGTGSYSKWLRNKPDNGRSSQSGSKKEHDCVIWYWSRNLGWADEHCENELPLICQLHLTTAPSTTIPTTSFLFTSKEVIMSSESSSGGFHIAYIIAIVAVIVAVTVIGICTFLLSSMLQNKKEKGRIDLLRKASIHPTLGGGPSRVGSRAYRPRRAFETPISWSMSLA